MIEYKKYLEIVRNYCYTTKCDNCQLYSQYYLCFLRILKYKDNDIETLIKFAKELESEMESK